MSVKKLRRNLSKIFAISGNNEKRRGELTCNQDYQFRGCTGCDKTNLNERCSEWEEDDVRKIMLASLKQSVILSVILILYSLESLRFGIKLKDRISKYQIAYV